MILDIRQKTALLFNNKLYEQIDGVSMGGSLGPVLVNIIMTECEKLIVDNLIKDKAIMFYVRYVEDTLLVIKRKDINFLLKQFKNFDKNLQFTIDTFENCVPHFLDTDICPNGLGFFHKQSQLGQHVHVDSYTLSR